MTAAERVDYYVTPEHYLVGEKISQRKHEYLAGVVYAVAGATLGHDTIAGNIYAELRQQLRGRQFRIFSSDVKVCVRKDAAEFYYYPDVTVDCSSVEASSLFADEPRVIFEVLSPDTERIDRGEKLRNYQGLPSLTVYVLVDQFHVAVTIYRRGNGEWTMKFLTAKNDVLKLPEIECALSLSAIYERTHLAN